jgi:hypothetical protein
VNPRAGAVRCAYCHGDAAGDVARCRRCGTLLHPECLAALRRCPTLGCVPASCGQADRPLGPMARALVRAGRWLLS